MSFKFWKNTERYFIKQQKKQIYFLALFFITLNNPLPVHKIGVPKETFITNNNFTGNTSNQVLVKFSSETPNDIKKRSIRQANGKVVAEILAINVTVLEVSDVQKSIDELMQEPDVVYAEPNYYVEMTEIYPNDPGWGNQYNLLAIRAPAGWALNTGAVWVTIAIIDTGVDLTHPDLFVRILPGYDFVNNDSDPQDDNGHGTHVAAIAAASTNNAVGIAGVNWGANIMPVKVLNASGGGSYANVANGIIWATDQGAQVINLSLGGGAPSFVLSDAVDYAYNRGVTLVASTGNAGAPAVLYPAAYSAVIAVGATDSSNSWAGFSNFGPEVDVVAPGVNIYSAYPSGGYGYRSGTSMSAPHVSGLAAILWGIPGNGPAGIRAIIESTSLDLGDPGWDQYFGYGLIQMDAAIQQALPTSTSTATLAPMATPTLTATIISLFDGNAGYPPVFQTGTYTSTAIINFPTPTTSLTMTNEVTNRNETATSTATPSDLFVNGQGTNDDWWVVCFGVVLILMGGLLFWLTLRKNRNKYLKKRF